MLRTPAYHRNRQTVRDSITNYTQVNELGVRNMHDMRKYSVNPYLIEHNLININQLWRRSISALWMMVRRNRKEINELRLEATG